MIWLAIGISAGTAVVLLINAVLTWKNFRQQKKVDTLKYFINIAPKITEFSEWLVDKDKNKRGWIDDLTKDKLTPSEKKCYTDKIQFYLSEIELLSIAVLKEKILEQVFIKDFMPHFEYQWKRLEKYIEWTRKKSNNPKAWIEMENLIKYLKESEKNKDSKGWIDTMKNLVKNVSPRR